MNGGFGYALGAGIDFLGGLLTNAANAKQNKKNRELTLHMFNEQMDRAYQRTTADMKKAGLNPILAAQNGTNHASASVPSNIPMQNPANFSSALGQAAEASASIAEKSANVRVTNATAAKAEAEAQVAQQTVAEKVVQEQQKTYKLFDERDKISAEIEKMRKSNSVSDADIQLKHRQLSHLNQVIKSVQNKNEAFSEELRQLELNNAYRQKELDFFNITNSARIAKDFGAALDSATSVLPYRQAKKLMDSVLTTTRGRGWTRTTKRNIYK